MVDKIDFMGGAAGFFGAYSIGELFTLSGAGILATVPKDKTWKKVGKAALYGAAAALILEIIGGIILVAPGVIVKLRPSTGSAKLVAPPVARAPMQQYNTKGNTLVVTPAGQQNAGKTVLLV